MSGFKMRKSLETMEEYSVEHVEADIIANANESNYPMPQKVVESINIVLEEFPFNRYPPIKAEILCELIGDDLGVDSSNIHIGNGSSELLQMACYAFGGNGKRIAFPYPSFSMYGVYVNMADSESLPYKLTEAGYIDADAVIEFCEENNPDLLIICNPNNPTGNYNKLEVIEKILANVKCPVLVDEAYMEFASGTSVDPHDLRPLNKLKLVAGSTLAVLHKYNNFICMRTFSKAYGLAGVRVGYAVGNSAMMRILGKTLLPYHVNAVSLLIGEEVYRNKDLYKEQMQVIINERTMMSEALLELGLRVWDSETNFLMCQPQAALVEKLATRYDLEFGLDSNKSRLTLAGKYIFKRLMQDKILVRDFTDHKLLQGCLRITVGMPEENAQIIATIKNICLEETINA